MESMHNILAMLSVRFVCLPGSLLRLTRSRIGSGCSIARTSGHTTSCTAVAGSAPCTVARILLRTLPPLVVHFAHDLLWHVCERSNVFNARGIRFVCIVEHVREEHDQQQFPSLRRDAGFVGWRVGRNGIAQLTPVCLCRLVTLALAQEFQCKLP